ncbi:MAG: tRNA 2-selenouridine(34) synthase MnmH [Gammaproteobacteria bacterium]|nr:tRNA 2-selenouridine(34) synthase MnmH [Gammaproteobacteria bacterium]
MNTDELEQTDSLRDLFLLDVPLLDVRAPVEFTAGAFPNAENHPLINDEERHRIGISYKDDGQDRAIELGHDLVSGQVKQERISAWRDYFSRHPDAVLYCFRGGMRSKISQRWLLEEVGIRCARVRGGYKAMRRFLIDQLERDAAACQPVVIGGRTGVGKTRLLTDCGRMVDLEGLAHHRGSAFGHHARPQPTQIDFENALAVAVMKRVADGNAPFAVEDESRNIGGRHIPPAFFERLQQAPLVLLEADLDERIAITLQEYVHDALGEFREVHGEQAGFDAWVDYLRGSTDKIRRRLGDTRHAEVRQLLDDAIERQRSSGDVRRHRDWIRFLLEHYYDGMYEYQLSKKTDRIVCRGNRDTVRAFLQAEYGI